MALRSRCALVPNAPELPKPKEGGADGIWGAAEGTAGTELSGALANDAPKLGSGTEAATDAAASVVAADEGGAGKKLGEVAGGAAETEGGARTSDGAAVAGADPPIPLPKKPADGCCVAAAGGKLPLATDWGVADAVSCEYDPERGPAQVPKVYVWCSISHALLPQPSTKCGINLQSVPVNTFCARRVQRGCQGSTQQWWLAS